MGGREDDRFGLENTDFYSSPEVSDTFNVGLVFGRNNRGDRE